MSTIAFLTPETLYSLYNPGRSPDLALKSNLPVNRQWCKKLFNTSGITVAGTVPDFHRIPFSADDETICITKIEAKVYKNVNKFKIYTAK